VVVGAIAFSIRKSVDLLELATFTAFTVAEKQSSSLAFIAYCGMNIAYAIVACVITLIMGVRIE
jgi:hypothetical protein